MADSRMDELAARFENGVIGLHVEGETPTIIIAVSVPERDMIVAALRSIPVQSDGPVARKTGIELADMLTDYLRLRTNELDTGDAANIIHFLHKAGALNLARPSPNGWKPGDPETDRPMAECTDSVGVAGRRKRLAETVALIGRALEKAFDLGFAWAQCLRGQNIEDSRAVGRTLQSYLFDGLNIDLTGFNSFKTGDEGIVEAKRRIKAALSQLPATDKAQP